jgi:zinc transporter ZupT
MKYANSRNSIIVMVIGWSLAIQYIILRSTGIIKPSQTWVWSDILGGISVLGAVIGIIGVILFIRADKKNDE